LQTSMLGVIIGFFKCLVYVRSKVQSKVKEVKTSIALKQISMN